MKIKKKIMIRIVKGILWSVGFLFLFFGVTKVLQPKYYFTSDSKSPETEMWNAYYQEPKESLDVLFLGSSHVYNAINPVTFYKESGLKGFDLCSSGQDLPTSYFYLKEALRYQKPKYVLMDTFGIFYEAFSDTACYKRSLDDMRWSHVKIEAIRDWQKTLKKESFLNRIFTIVDYHSRWDSLKQEDFDADGSMTNINGYCPYFDYLNDIEHIYYHKDAEVPELDEQALSYFRKILQLCEEKEITFYLCSVPDATWTEKHAKVIEKLAKEHRIPYIDYNQDDIYQEIGMVDCEDWRDLGHLNSRGAEKFSTYLAKDCLKLGWMEANAMEDPVWEERVTSWEHEYLAGMLYMTVDFDQYLAKLKHPDYSVFMSVKDEGSHGLNYEMKENMMKLGLSCMLYGKERNSYFAVISGGEILEQAGEEELYVKGTLPDGKTEYEVLSAGFKAGNKSSIRIHDREYSVGKRGLNIVVYDNVSHKVIDSICFDTHHPMIRASRKEE